MNITKNIKGKLIQMAAAIAVEETAAMEIKKL